MGLSGGAKTTSGSAQKWAQPYAKAAAGEVQSVYNANQPQLQQITKGVTDLLPSLSGSFSSWSPVSDQSRGYYSDVLSGKYLDPSSNPGLNSVLGRLRRDVTDSVNSNASMVGRYGSEAHTDVLSRNLAEQEGAILADQYNRERGMMDSAAGAVPQISASQLAQLLQASGVGAELPYTGTNSLASALSALFSSGVQKQGGGLGNFLSSAAQVGSAALIASDRRLKTDIEKVGELDDGLGVYEWTYVWGGGRHRGVMADEIEALRPWALGPAIAGYATVNYAAL